MFTVNIKYLHTERITLMIIFKDAFDRLAKFTILGLNKLPNESINSSMPPD